MPQQEVQEEAGAVVLLVRDQERLGLHVLREQAVRRPVDGEAGCCPMTTQCRARYNGPRADESGYSVCTKPLGHDGPCGQADEHGGVAPELEAEAGDMSTSDGLGATPDRKYDVPMNLRELRAVLAAGRVIKNAGGQVNSDPDLNSALETLDEVHDFAQAAEGGQIQ